MCSLETLKNDINNVRSTLHSLINKKQGDLLDKEIISVSQQLDTLLNKYNSILSNAKNKKDL